MQKYRKKDHERLYRIWGAMKRRCNDVKFARYPQYGAKGIQVCDEWMDKESGFSMFAEWALSHGYTDEMTIERINVNGNYEPNNCTWITMEEQSYNKRNTVYVMYQGEQVSLAKLCKEKNANYHSIYYRIHDMGWSADDAFSIPSLTDTEFSRKCKEHNMPLKLVKDRIRKLGWDEEKALTTPVRPMKKPQKILH